MDYVVAIPSYKRSDQIAKKTLNTLQEGNVSLDKIYIFVIPEEEELYEKNCPGYQIIPGVLGLVNQRKFIQDYFPLDTNIVFMDDDITQIYRPTSNNTKAVIDYLPSFFIKAFSQMDFRNLSIWGVYPVDNIMFAFNNPRISLDLRYIVGAFYGIKNTKSITLNYGDALEDRERTILYYIKERQTLRFNYICFKTKYFGKGGLQSPDRLQKHSESSSQIVKKYPEFCRLKQKKKYIDCVIKSR